MEDTIRVALARWRDRQPNMASESFRNNLAQEIALLLREKGSYIEFTDSEIDEQKARETWVCSICGENTADVEYDYVGSWLKLVKKRMIYTESHHIIVLLKTKKN